MSDLLDQVRDHYVEQFQAFLLEQGKRLGGAGEIKLKLSEESQLYLQLYCADFVSGGDEPRVIELHPDRVLQFETASATIGQMEVSLASLSWDSAEFEVTGVNIEAEMLRDWFLKWFDPDDSRSDENAEISGNVHSVLLAENKISVDFGTSPVDAFHELLHLIAEAGATGVRVTNPRDS